MQHTRHGGSSHTLSLVCQLTLLLGDSNHTHPAPSSRQICSLNPGLQIYAAPWLEHGFSCSSSKAPGLEVVKSRCELPFIHLLILIQLPFWLILSNYTDSFSFHDYVQSNGYNKFLLETILSSSVSL